MEKRSIPRPPGSEGEGWAVEYVARELRWVGLEPHTEAFLGGIFGIFSPLAGFFISIWAPFLLWYALTRADSPVRFLLPRVKSRNVVAVIPSRKETKVRAAILAHLGTNRVRLAWSAGNAAGIRWGTLGTLSAYLLIPVLLLATLASGSR